MEIVGGVASASQLTNYFIGSIVSLFDAYQKVKSRPEQLRRRLEQIDRLGCTVQDIQGSETFRSNTILEQLKTLSCAVQVLRNALEKLLARQNKAFVKRFCTTWLKDTDNRKLEDLLHSIEAEKTSLLLSIQLNLQRGLLTQSYEVSSSEQFMSSRRLQKHSPGATKLVEPSMPKPVGRSEDDKKKRTGEKKMDKNTHSGEKRNQASQDAERAENSDQGASGDASAAGRAAFLYQNFKINGNTNNNFGTALSSRNWEFNHFELGGDSSNNFNTLGPHSGQGQAPPLREADVPSKNNAPKK